MTNREVQEYFEEFGCIIETEVNQPQKTKKRVYSLEDQQSDTKNDESKEEEMLFWSAKITFSSIDDAIEAQANVNGKIIKNGIKIKAFVE